MDADNLDRRKIYHIVLYIGVLFAFLGFLTAFWSFSKFEASQKLLWIDEHEWTLNSTCRKSYSKLLLSGGEVGFGSLYFIFTKSALTFLKVDPSDDPKEILIKLRWTSRVSIIAYLILVALIAHGIFNVKIYWLPVVMSAAFGYLHLDSGGIFWASLESRTYGLWMAFSSLHIWAFARMLKHWALDETLRLNDYILFSISSILLLYTAKPGIVQTIILAATCIGFKRISVFFTKPYIFVTLIVLLAAVQPLYLALFKKGYEGLVNKWSCWGLVVDFILKHKENPALFMLVCLGWVGVLRDHHRILSRLILSQLILLVVVVAAIHVYKYYFIPRVIIFGHLLTVLLVVSGIKELGRLIEGFHHRRKALLTQILLLSIISLVAVYSSPTFKQMLLFQVKDKSHFTRQISREDYQKNIDILQFPICGVR